MNTNKNIIMKALKMFYHSHSTMFSTLWVFHGIVALSLIFGIEHTQGATPRAVQDGSWSNNSTWNTGTPPTSSDDPYIVGGYTVTIESGTAAKAKALFSGHNGANGTLTINGGDLQTKEAQIGKAGASTNTDSGVINLTSGSWTNETTILIGLGNGAYTGNGFLNVSGGNLTSTGNITVGYNANSVGELTISDGSVTAKAVLRIAGNNQSTGTVTISGGTLDVASSLVVGDNGPGTLNITGGTITATSTTTYVGQSAGSSGVVNLTGGTFVASDIQIGTSAAAGTLNLGGTNVGGGSVGTLTATKVYAGSGNGAVNFNNNSTYTSTTKVSGVLKVNQIGSGTTIITNSDNDYSGGTTISAGTLLVRNTSGSGTGTGAVTVSSGGTLGGDGIISGNVTVQNGGKLSPGNSPGLLTISNLTLQSGAETLMEINGTGRGTTFDAINVGGSLTYGGKLTLTFGYTPLITDTFDLFNFSSQSGTFSSIDIVNPGYAASMDYSTGVLSLSAIPEPSTWILMFAGMGAILMVSMKHRFSKGKVRR